MNIDIQIQDTLPQRLTETLNRQLSYKLGSKAASVEWIKASLTTLKVEAADQAPSDQWVSCVLQAKTRSGTTLRAHTRGRYPNICIADACSRLGRSVARAARFSAHSNYAQPATNASHDG